MCPRQKYHRSNIEDLEVKRKEDKSTEEATFIGTWSSSTYIPSILLPIPITCLD